MPTCLTSLSTAYSVVGIDDFNDDILWRNTDGSMVAWQMANSAINGTVP